MPNIDENKVNVFADNILNKIKEMELPFDIAISDDIKLTEITASLGVVTWDKVESVPANKLLSLVESALKNAKKEGRSKKVQFQFYNKTTKDGNL